MSIRYLFLCCAFVTVAAANDAPTPPSSKALLHSATLLLAEDSSSVEQEEALAAQLLEFANAHPADTHWAELMMTAQFLLFETDLCEKSFPVCVALSNRVPHSEFASESFEMLWNYHSDRTNSPVAAAEFGINLAVEVTNPLATEYFHRAMNALLEEGLWNIAVEEGLRYIRNAPEIFEPAVYLDVAGAMLKSGESSRAMELLARAVEHFPRTPAAVQARSELGLIQLALGDVANANDSFSQAWSTWYKYRRHDGFDQPPVVHSASRALWEVQEHDFSELRRKFDDRLLTSDRQVRRAKKNILRGYELVMETDSTFAPQCWTRIGDLYRAFAEAHLLEGYEQLSADEHNSQNNPYDRSLDYYEDAVNAYTHARLAAHEQKDLQLLDRHWSDLSIDWERLAIRERFATLSRQAEVIYQWADEVWEHAPTRGLGSDGLQPRFELLVNRVIPIVDHSLQVRTKAFDAVVKTPSEFHLEKTWQTVESQANHALETLTELCGLQWKAMSASAVQLSKTLQITGDPAAVKTLRETLVGQMGFADDYWKRGQQSIGDLYDTYLQCQPSEEVRTFWEQQLMLFHFNYAEIVGRTHRDIEESVTGLDPLDPIAITLKQRLRSIAADASRAERNALTTAMDMANRFSIYNEAYSDIYSRLREIDPKRYPHMDIHRASRK